MHERPNSQLSRSARHCMTLGQLRLPKPPTRPSAFSPCHASLQSTRFADAYELCYRSEVFKFRNYDPETGTARKHARVDEDDTVEKQVEGLAEKVIAEDEARRAQELVSV